MTWKKEVEKQLILLVNSGSRAYGTNTETSDQDYKGILIPDASAYFGLDEEKDYTYSSGGNAGQNGQEDVDVHVYGIKHFARQAMKGNLNALEVLFGDESDILYETEAGKALRENRHLFLSNGMKNSFGGFAKQHRIRLEKGLKQRPELVERYGYDTKTLMHAVRVYQMGMEAFRTGTFHTKRTNAAELLAIRNGAYRLEEIDGVLDALERQFQEACACSVLPEQVDKAVINTLLMTIITQVLSDREATQGA